MFGEWQVVPTNLLVVARSADKIAVDLAAIIHDSTGALVASTELIDKATLLMTLNEIGFVLKDADEEFLQDLGLRNVPSIQAMPLNNFEENKAFDQETDSRLWAFMDRSDSSTGLIEREGTFTNQTDLTSFQSIHAHSTSVNQYRQYSPRRSYSVYLVYTGDEPAGPYNR
jgi:hypothetical protein